MGIVDEAKDKALGRRVALKLLPPQWMSHPTAVGRFRREARAAGQLHHTNIVPVFGEGED
jgi:serine/threonine protein kinase